MKKQSGFSLLELLLVLAVVAAIAVGAFIVYPRVQAARVATETAQTLATAQASVAALFTSGNYDNLSASVAHGADVFPDHMKVDVNNAGAGFVNQWDGSVDVRGSGASGSAPGGGASARFMTFEHTNIPSDVCKKLIPAASSSFGRIQVGAQVLINRYDTATNNDTLNEQQLMNACDLIGDGDTIAFTAR